MNNKTTEQVLNKFKSLGNNIKAKRITRKLTQNQLAEKVDISREHLAKIETAKRSVSLDLLIKIADNLDYKVKDFIDF